MGVKNYPLYKITDHARVRIQYRFNITKNDMEAWTSRLLSQAVFVSSQDHFREKYRLNDIVVIIDTRQKVVVTVYSENEHDDNGFKVTTNPEVKTAINEALDLLVKQKKVKTAGKIYNNILSMLDCCERMKNPHVNHRFADVTWGQLMNEFNQIQHALESSGQVIEEAKRKMAEG